MERKQKATERYRQKLHDLGLDNDFEYVEFVYKGFHRIKCRKCGELLKRSDDIFRGKTSRLKCRNCKNGTITFSKEVDEILAFYSSGHSTAETCKKFGVGKYRLQNWVKVRGVSNGRTFEEGSRECNKARAEAAAVPRKLSHNASHYRRARLHGAPAEVGITLPKLIKRDGLTCSICGLPCFYGGSYQSDLYPTIDHIVPISKGGGHTWNNVQVAHRLCNINKRDLIGREWNNAD